MTATREKKRFPPFSVMEKSGAKNTRVERKRERQKMQLHKGYSFLTWLVSLWRWRRRRWNRNWRSLAIESDGFGSFSRDEVGSPTSMKPAAGSIFFPISNTIQFCSVKNFSPSSFGLSSFLEWAYRPYSLSLSLSVWRQGRKSTLPNAPN